MEMFDELIGTTVMPDGKVDAELVQPDPKEVENAVADFVKSAREFRILHSCPDGATDSGRRGILWWRALEWLAFADSRLKDIFCGPDRSPASIAQFHKYKLHLIDDRKPYRADA
jgi:hypothetical protein